jgi:cell division protein FtsI/penicillin-binding protein 2
MAKKRQQNFIRYNSFTGLMTVILFVLVGRMVDIQLVHRDVRTQKAKKQHQSVTQLKPDRGKIYDRNGSIFAFNVPSVTIVANVDSITDKHAVAARISRITDVTYNAIVDKLKGNHGWVELAKKQPVSIKEKVKNADLDFVGCRDELMRSYPQGKTAGQVVGFTRSDGVGGYGLEMAMEKRLQGAPGTAIMQRTGRARLFSNPHFPIQDAKDGDDVVLTLDSRYQRIAETELQKTIWEYNAKGGSVVILDPKNGDILAICSEPGFDPNEYGDYDNYAWKLAAITDQFEPGSTFKPAMLSAMLDAGYKTQDEVISCGNGRWDIMGETINDTKPHGDLSVRDVLVLSSNIGMAKLAKDFDKTKMYDYAVKFGFGKKAGIEMLGEINGTMSTPRRWVPFSQLAFSYGHEIAVTPLQMCAMYATIANDGFYISPRVVKGIFRNEQPVRFDQKRIKRSAISQETSILMRDIMEEVVVRGTGVNAAIENMSICGKTGTAHMVSSGGGYAAHRYVSSFGGFFPKEKPQLVIFVMVKEPRGAYYGGTVAAPCFKRIAQGIINLEGADYYNSTNDLMADTRTGVMPNLVGMAKSDAVQHMRKNILEFRVFGGGDIIGEQEPAAGDSLLTDGMAYLTTAYPPTVVDSVVVVPQVTELSLRSALNLLAEKNLGFNIQGTGKVRQQRPSAGERVAKGSKVELICKAAI